MEAISNILKATASIVGIRIYIEAMEVFNIFSRIKALPRINPMCAIRKYFTKAVVLGLENTKNAMRRRKMPLAMGING
jgi:hypothetical protein